MGQYLLQAVKKDQAAAGQDGSGGGVTYELYCRQDGDRTASSGELQDLAERLSKLETAVGTNELRTGVSCSNCESVSLTAEGGLVAVAFCCLSIDLRILVMNLIY